MGILVSFAPIVKVAKQKANQLSTSDELRTLQRNKEKLEAESSEGEKTKYDELYDAISSYNELIYKNGQDTFRENYRYRRVKTYSCISKMKN